MKVEFLSPEEVQKYSRNSRSRKSTAGIVQDQNSMMPESLNFVPPKEGLAALNKFLNKEDAYDRLSPFTLPVNGHVSKVKSFYAFNYVLGRNVNGKFRHLVFYLSAEKSTCLGQDIYLIPRSNFSKGQNPYYWLDLQATPEAKTPLLNSCRLRPEVDQHQIDFKTWHGLKEQLLSDYIWGVNHLRFTDLLPFTIVVKNNSTFYYKIAGRLPSFNLGGNSTIQSSDTLKVIPKTDDQKFYEWVDILKVTPSFPEEKWPLVCSYRISTRDHTINSLNWLGPERQLLKDFIDGKSHIKFRNLKPIRSTTRNNGQILLFHTTTDKGLLTRLSYTPSLLGRDEEVIAVPQQDDQKIYQWLELYRFDPAANSPFGEVLVSGRITPKGIDQRNWLGVERQLLKDFLSGLVRWDQLKPIPLKAGVRNIINLWKENHRTTILIYSLRLHLAQGDNLTLRPEKEAEEGADFLLTKNDIALARYRLDLKTKKFTCVDNLVAEKQSPKQEATENDALFEEYKNLLLAGQIMSYAEFKERKQL